MKPDKKWVEEAKRNAALEAVKHVKNNSAIGLGSGSTTAYAIKEIGNRIRREDIHIVAVPTSYQASALAIKHGIPTTTLDVHPMLDLTIDGADQIDNGLNLIKGMGGALTREKIVASTSKTLIIIADERKKVKFLGENRHPVPIEVLPFATQVVMNKIEKAKGKPSLRQSNQKVGPVITDNGNFIIDVNFGPIQEPKDLEHRLKSIPGIIETGLFVKMADTVYIGNRSGTKQL